MKNLTASANHIEALKNQREDVARWLKHEGDRRADIGTFNVSDADETRWNAHMGALRALDEAIKTAQAMHEDMVADA